MAARFHFTRAQCQARAEIQVARDHGQRGLAHRFGAGPGKCAFVGLGQALEQHCGHQQVDDASAQEFQALVVWSAGAAMGQGLLLGGDVARDALATTLTQASGDLMTEEQANRFVDIIYWAAQSHLAE